VRIYRVHLGRIILMQNSRSTSAKSSS
jgi:hypothetical protein